MNYMVDIETLGDTPRAVVTSIAVMDIDNPSSFVHITGINVEEQLRQGAMVNGDTLNWWSKQPPELFKQQLASDTSLDEAMNAVCNFLPKYFNTIWAKGDSFDLPILRFMFNSRSDNPFKWWGKYRDFRTISKLYPNKELLPARTGDAHNALSDCQYQTEWLVNIRKAHGLELK